MKKIILLFFLFFAGLSSFGQKKNSFKAFLDHKQFYHPEIGNLLEIHIQFIAYTLKFTGVEGGLQSEVAIQYKITNELQELVHSDAYRLKSPLMRDSVIEDFYELKRIALKPGKYTFDLILTDLQSDNEPITAVQEIELVELGNDVLISNIEPAELMFKTITENAFSKAGYDIIPRISNYYTTYSESIPVYFELYQPKKDENITFGLRQRVINTKTNEEVESLTRFSKVEVGQVLPMIKVIDISNLFSGEYELEFTLISKENTELTRSSYFFERLNNFETTVNIDNVIIDPSFQASVTDDSLKYFIASLIPISNKSEVKNLIRVLKTKNTEQYRKYLQSYWVTLTNGQKTYEAWMRYKSQVFLVQRLYSNNFMDGYETDRGRVYLQYGPPSNIITREVSASETPFEIWRYDKIKTFSNRKFIFYNPDLVNNNYRLLHSDVIGETKNPRWQQYIQKRGSYNTDVYDTKDGLIDSFGNKSGEFINQY